MSDKTTFDTSFYTKKKELYNYLRVMPLPDISERKLKIDNDKQKTVDYDLYTSQELFKYLKGNPLPDVSRRKLKTSNEETEFDSSLYTSQELFEYLKGNPLPDVSERQKAMKKQI